MQSVLLLALSPSVLWVIIPGAWLQGRDVLGELLLWIGLRAPPLTVCPLPAHRYQQILHRNLVYLATIADSNQNMQSLLPAVSARGGGGGRRGQVLPQGTGAGVGIWGS